ncbi:MAG: Senescence-associated protein [Rhodobacteraceae bacterium HLUCCA12]|nr:MAG: Senescence-associated protein [Rhodobacteraceae bacterium HLUCCA12]
MNFLSDILVAAAAVGAAIFCLVLSRRLRALTTLDGGMGSAIAILSAQVDGLAKTLDAAQKSGQTSARALETNTRRAEAACRQLELLLASLHDLPTAPEAHNRPTQDTGNDLRHHLTNAAPRPAGRLPDAAATGLDAPLAPRSPRILRRRATTGAAG